MKPLLSQNIERSITLNGDTCTVPGGSTVASLIRDLGLKTDRVAVELNRKIVTRTAWEGTEIPDAAQIEIVQLVGGG
jgi:thiamine biosynthesis protein ThiS